MVARGERVGHHAAARRDRVVGQQPPGGVPVDGAPVGRGGPVVAVLGGEGGPVQAGQVVAEAPLVRGGEAGDLFLVGEGEGKPDGTFKLTSTTNLWGKKEL